MSQDFRPVIKEMLAEKDAEIERLKAQVKELSEAYQKAIGPIQPAKDAEIERLKLALHHEKQYAADLITTLRCEAEDKDKLITELADTLVRANPTDRHKALIQRAREATK